MNKMPEQWRPRYWILDADGRTPIGTQDLHEWARLCASQGEDAGGRRVGWDYDNERGITVSTTFMGIDHNYMPSGPPILFETMIFGGPHDQYTERYATWDEAERGHQRAMDLAGIKRKLETWIDGEQTDGQP